MIDLPKKIHLKKSVKVSQLKQKLKVKKAETKKYRFDRF
jgi:hypothetical protein